MAAMLDPAFYPNRPEEILHKETHISHVFLAGDLVYKIKKPVRFPFLDFSTAAKRRHFLDAELRLNRRLAPAIYLGVVPICHDLRGWRLEGSDRPCEHALLMRRLPEKRMLDYLLQTEQATAAMMEQLADRLAAFHAAAQPITSEVSNDHLAATAREWRKNLAELEPLLRNGAAHADLKAIAAAGEHFLRSHAVLIERRATEGWIRDVHGDLHAEHICFAPDGIQIFDCIEFNDELRRCDLASENAFLLMDLSVRGGEPLVEPFLRRYLEMLNDADMRALLPFYQCYRALVRAKVHALRSGRWNDEAARYFHIAQRFTWARSKPFLVLVCGLPGSGKSTLARALGERLQMPVHNSDVIRKKNFKTTGGDAVALNRGMYGPAATSKTYALLARSAEKEILAGNGAVLDATFGRKSQRRRIARLSEAYKIPLIVIHCSISEAVTSSRLRLRAAQGTDISDARWDTYVAHKAPYEPIDEVKPESILELDTDAPVEELVRRCERFLRLRLL